MRRVTDVHVYIRGQQNVYNTHFIRGTEHLVDWILILMACPKAYLSLMCALISSQSPQIFSFNGL